MNYKINMKLINLNVRYAIKIIARSGFQEVNLPP